MRTSTVRNRSTNADPETRYAIKAAARRLFAERGVDGVSIREIVTLAGQRNGGSVHYHFGSKEALVGELIVDGARQIDDLRNARLDTIARRGSSPTLREVIEILVSPAVMIGDDTYLRFINALQLNHRQVFLDALADQWNSGYRRCLAHLRTLLPDLPPLLLNQRLVFMDIYMTSAMAAREAALDDQGASHPFWKTPYVMANFIDSMEHLLAGPVSNETRAIFESRKGSKRAIQNQDGAGDEQ